jgi:hypothetical protein
MKEDVMAQFRSAAIALAVIAGAGPAHAQTMIITREPARTETVVTTQRLELSPVQRQTVYRAIVAQPVQPATPTVEYRVGMHVPATAQLYAVPQEVAVEVPALKTYKYFVVNRRVVLVDPATSEVVAELQ